MSSQHTAPVPRLQAQPSSTSEAANSGRAHIQVAQQAGFPENGALGDGEQRLAIVVQHMHIAVHQDVQVAAGLACTQGRQQGSTGTGMRPL